MSKRFASLLMLISGILLLSIMPAFAQDDDVFPITIEHKFGTTTITEVPERVVAIGYIEQDPLLALGVTPVAVRYWYGDENDAIFSWADEYVEGDEPVILNMPFGTLNYEAILALDPDLISAVSSGITQEEYELLSQIAPTIAQTDEYIDFGVPWQAATQMIGDALGKSEAASELVANLEAAFEEVRAENPDFEGKTIAVIYSYGTGTYGFYTDQDVRGRFFSELGFVIPEELVEIAGESFYADISTETIELLDRDLIVILNLQFIEGGRETLLADPLFAQLDAVQEGRIVYLEPEQENALGFSSVLSLPYALETVVPLVQEALANAS